MIDFIAIDHLYVIQNFKAYEKDIDYHGGY